MKVLKWLDHHVEEILLVFLLALITIVMGLQILCRAVGYPLTWTEECARFLFVWSGFLSISYCFRKKISLKIDLFVDKMPPRVKVIFIEVEDILMVIFYAYMVRFAWDYFSSALQNGGLSPALQIPLYLIQVSPLIGFILTVIRLIQKIVGTARTMRKKDVEV